MILLDIKYSTLISIRTIQKEDLFPENWLELFFSLNNPLFYALLFVTITVAIFYVVVLRHSIPLQKKHKREKEEIENRNNRLLALFAQLDPDPVLRFNKEGEIILANRAGNEILKLTKGKKIFDVIRIEPHINTSELIRKNREVKTEIELGEKVYSLVIRGVKELNIGQVYFSDVTELKLYELKLEESKKKLTDLTHYLQNVLEEERGRISKELHDGIGQTLAYVKLKLEPLRNGKVLSILENFQLYEDLNKTISEAVNELKKISYNLKPRMLDDLGLIQSLAILVKEVSREKQIKGSFEPNDFDERLDPNLEVNIYRICQELLHNIAKHSQATSFFLQIIKLDKSLKIIVDDDGIGFNPNRMGKKSGMGLYNISERVANYNGVMHIDSNPGSGTVIIIEFPVNGNGSLMAS